MQAIDRTAMRIGLGGVTPAAAFMISLGSLGGRRRLARRVRTGSRSSRGSTSLPAAFDGCTRGGDPAFALVTQTIIAALFVVMGQAGTTVRGAYGILVNMAIITFFIP